MSVQSTPDTARCGARYHGTASAYTKHRCRCADARAAHGRYQASLQLGTAPPGRVPAVASTRRVRALYLAGHDAPAIAAVSALNVRSVSRIAAGIGGPTILASTAAQVADVTDRLMRLPGTRPAARRRAQREGWAPLFAWDGDVFAIDDPAADDALAARTAGLAPSLRRVLRDEAIAEAAEAAQRAATARALLSRARHTRWAQNGAQRPTGTTLPANGRAPHHGRNIA